MEQEIIQTKTSKVCFGEDGIIRSIQSPDVKQTLAETKEIITAIAKLSKGEKYPIYVDIRAVKSISREARIYLAGEEAAKVQRAVALHIASPVSRILGNLFIGINKPILQTKLFTSEAEAIKWLKDFKIKDMESKAVLTRTSKIWLDENGIIQVIYLSNVEVTLADAREINKVAKTFIKNKRPFCISMKEIKSMSREARLYFARGEDTTNIVSATAVITGSSVSKVIGNIFIGLNKSIIPFKLFISKEEAMKWLKDFNN